MNKVSHTCSAEEAAHRCSATGEPELPWQSDGQSRGAGTRQASPLRAVP